MQEVEGSEQLDHYWTKSRVRTTGSLQFGHSVSGDGNSRFIPVASDSLEHLVLQKNDFSHSFLYPPINTLIPTKCRELPEIILREKL